MNSEKVQNLMFEPLSSVLLHTEAKVNLCLLQLLQAIFHSKHPRGWGLVGGWGSANTPRPCTMEVQKKLGGLQLEKGKLWGAKCEGEIPTNQRGGVVRGKGGGCLFPSRLATRSSSCWSPMPWAAPRLSRVLKGPG